MTTTRKAGKKRIASAMREYVAWRSAIQPRIDALNNDDARRYIGEWADEVRSRIESGDLGICTSALAASVRRDIESWQTGYYARVGANGERYVNVYATAGGVA
jgi:hypothetical protein